MTDDAPLDLLQVSADDAALDALRTGSAETPDPALALLRALLADVEADLPQPAPTTCGSTVLTLANEQSPERRLARSGTVVAFVTAGLVALGGVAAASTMAPESSPLHGVGEAVRSAAGAVVGAVSPPRAPAPASPDKPATGAAAAVVVPPRPVTPVPAPAERVLPDVGTRTSTAVRLAAATRQVDALLDSAEEHLAADRLPAASAQLDAAERRLAELAAADRGVRSARLAKLREQLAAAQQPQPAEPQAADERQSTDKPDPAARPAAPSAGQSRRETPTRVAPERPARVRELPRPTDLRGAADRAAPGQLSKDASMKPRA